MPSRKSDASRRSDVSAARFVLAEDTNMASAPEPSAAPAASAAQSQSQPEPTTTSAPATEQPPSANQSFAQSVGGASTTSPSAEKKDHHGKEKEKEKGDAVTIEVCIFSTLRRQVIALHLSRHFAWDIDSRKLRVCVERAQS